VHRTAATRSAFCPWAGVAPGNNESAGKNLSGATAHGNTWLLGALGDAAAAAARTKRTYLGVYYKRIARRRGTKRALVAAMHNQRRRITFPGDQRLESARSSSPRRVGDLGGQVSDPLGSPAI
jgi:transposase